jgi:hypothetical protein
MSYLARFILFYLNYSSLSKIVLSRTCCVSRELIQIAEIHASVGGEKTETGSFVSEKNKKVESVQAVIKTGTNIC